MIDWKDMWPERVTAGGQLKRGLSQEEKTEVFIYRANQIHGRKYTYDSATYVNSYTKLTIRCPAHGDFEQTPNGHLKGKGCLLCVDDSKRKTTEEFVREATLVHKGKYTYNNSVYINKRSKILITCPMHGGFEQRPDNHLGGNGCPHCVDRAESTHVYLLKYGEGVYKIGVTNNITRRLLELKRGYPGDIEVIVCVSRPSSADDEKYLLNKYKQRPALVGRPFDGYTELRELTQEEVEEICLYLDQN